MKFHDKLRKLFGKSYYERAAQAAAEASSKKAVRARIGEKELADLRHLKDRPEQAERIYKHTAVREGALKKVAFLKGFLSVQNKTGRG